MDMIMEECPEMIAIHVDVAVHNKDKEDCNINLLDLTIVVVKNDLVFNPSNMKSNDPASHSMAVNFRYRC